MSKEKAAASGTGTNAQSTGTKAATQPRDARRRFMSKDKTPAAAGANAAGQNNAASTNGQRATTGQSKSGADGQRSFNTKKTPSWINRAVKPATNSISPAR